MRVLFLPEVRQYFSELIRDIERTLHLRVGRPAPMYFERYGKGMRYAVFPKSRVTQWYVFFTQYYVDGDIIYLVRYITTT